jgi:hypothetical protein
VAKGDALYRMGRLDGARRAYRAAAAIDQASVGALVGLGRTMVRADPAAAESLFRAALLRDPRNAAALNDLGITLDLQRRHAEAQDVYRAAIATGSDTTAAEINLGMSYAVAGRHEDALRLLRAVAIDPGLPGSYRQDLAAALALAGDTERAANLSGPDQAIASAGSADGSPSANPLAAPLVREDWRSNESPRTIAASYQPMTSTEVRSVPLIDTPAMESAAPAPVTAKPLGAPLRAPPMNSGAEPSSEARVIASSGAWASAASVEKSGRFEKSGEIEHPSATIVQLASMRSEKGVRAEWHRLQHKLPMLLRNRTAQFDIVSVHDRPYWRLMTHGFADREAAESLCKIIRRGGGQCLVRTISSDELSTAAYLG